MSADNENFDAVAIGDEVHDDEKGDGIIVGFHAPDGVEVVWGEGEALESEIVPKSILFG